MEHKNTRECNVSVNNNGDLMVDYFVHNEEGIAVEVKCISYESRICAIADVQRYILHGELRDYDNDYQRYHRWICNTCGRDNTAFSRLSEHTCSYCKSERK